jgi:hypothetical protein
MDKKTFNVPMEVKSPSVATNEFLLNNTLIKVSNKARPKIEIKKKQVALVTYHHFNHKSHCIEQ